MAHVSVASGMGEGRNATSAEPEGSREFADAIPLRLHGVPTGLGEPGERFEWVR
ncbi:MAG TPA: hypothetical protein VL485_15515 [Ktedonobacteraceae bacterium]|jgi:hypothetical protein|nr:hypothetical protein [Ktedonobacteraceae bacterium]